MVTQHIQDLNTSEYDWMCLKSRKATSRSERLPLSSARVVDGSALSLLHLLSSDSEQWVWGGTQRGVDRELLNVHSFGSVGDGGGGELDDNDCRIIFGALLSLHLSSLVSFPPAPCGVYINFCCCYILLLFDMLISFDAIRHTVYYRWFTNIKQ